MNIKQMQYAIKRFRASDVSVIQDEKLRARAQKLQAKQGGFTLLELLVVITLIATLATGALVAYEGLGENAADSSTANALISSESAIRNYRAVENKYPNQWDNLATLDGSLDSVGNGTGDPLGSQLLLADETKAFFGQWVHPVTDTNGVLAKVAQALEEVGIDELQTIPATTTDVTGLVPNLAWNESGGAAASELELWDDDNETLAVNFDDAAITTTDVALSIVPAGGTGTCTVDETTAISIASDFEGTAKGDSSALNLINDGVDDDACTLVLALGYGKDVPGTTLGSRVAIGQVPTAATTDVNPAENYARVIALFQVGLDGSDGTDEDGNITSSEIFSKARLIGVVDPEGRAIDTVLAAANEGA